MLKYPKLTWTRFNICRDGFFAAASCMSFQQCRFNFGSEPFKYPPKSRSFDSFNAHAYLKEQDKIVLPRHLFLEQLRKMSVHEDSCTLCFDAKGNVRLEPCKHRWENWIGFYCFWLRSVNGLQWRRDTRGNSPRRAHSPAMKFLSENHIYWPFPLSN